jgi:hypothetical protein
MYFAARYHFRILPELIKSISRMKKLLLLSWGFMFLFPAYSQTTQDIVNRVSLDTLVKNVRELSGEDSTVIGGQKVRIVHRVSKRNNDLAAAYITEKFKSYGINTFEHNYRPGGKNILGEIKGKTNPDSIYIICAHYDSVTDYCADDNASGTSAILEAARILSDYCLENTVIFALWDEEERGLIGSKFYGAKVAARGDRIKGVFNMDMLGYDSDSNHVFDIHTNSLAHNQALKDSLLYLVDTLNLTLVPQVINPGTNRSDHAAFWQAGFPAVFFGESFLGGDPTPAYHSKNDRIALFNLPYYHNLSRLATAVITEYAGIIQPDRSKREVQACEQFVYWGRTFTESGIYRDTNMNIIGCDSIHTLNLTIINISDSVSRDDRILTAVDTGSSYQWFNCDEPNEVLFADTLRQYTVNQDGSFAVELTKSGCKDTSDCFDLNISSTRNISQNQFNIYPNPTDGPINVDLLNPTELWAELYSLKGEQVQSWHFDSRTDFKMNLNQKPGMYFLKLGTNSGSKTLRVIVQ